MDVWPGGGVHSACIGGDDKVDADLEHVGTGLWWGGFVARAGAELEGVQGIVQKEGVRGGGGDVLEGLDVDDGGGGEGRVAQGGDETGVGVGALRGRKGARVEGANQGSERLHRECANSRCGESGWGR